MRITRRRFLKGSTYCAALYAASPAFAGEQNGTPDEADVVIIGSGIAGLACALSAKGNNPSAHIVVLEKNTTPFYCSTAYASGLFNVSVPHARGPGSLYQELLDLGHGLNNRDLLAAYVDNSQAALNWFVSHGVQVAPKSNPAFSGRKTYLPKNGGGVRYLEALYVETERLGISFVSGSKALQLKKDTSGRVSEVVFSRGVTQHSLRAKHAVVLATGGFMGNTRKIDHYCGSNRKLFTFSSPASQGEGLEMATEIGADTCLLDKVAGYAYGVPLDVDTRRGLIFRGDFLCSRGAIAVDNYGRRFVNEELNSPSVFGVMQNRAISECFVIASNPQLHEFLKEDFPYVIGWDRQRFIRELETSGTFIQRFESIAQMAGRIGISPTVLSQTIQTYNTSLATGKDRNFGRNVAGFKPLAAPFFLFACRSVAGVSLGGLQVLPTMNVIDVHSEPIKGLFAVGEIVGGIHGDNFAGGSSLSSAATLGFLAGRCVWTQDTETLA